MGCPWSSSYESDFWEKAAQDQSPYPVIQDQFSWNVPEYYNIGCDVSDKRAAHRGQVAIIYDKGNGGHEKWTFWDLATVSDRFANVLRGLGLQRGDRMAVFLSQCPELVVAHISGYKLGAIVVPLFVLFGPEALIYRLNDSNAKVLVTDKAHASVIMDNRNKLPDLEHVILVDESVPGTSLLAGLLANSSTQIQAVMTHHDDPAVIIYTSGTTGAAKGALHAHQVLLGHLPGVSLSHDLFPRPGDVIWTPADWAWIGGMFDVLFPALHWGVPVLARRMEKFDPEEAYSMLEKWGIRNLFLPPTAIKMMRQVENPRNRWSLDIRSMASGGEPLGQQTVEWARETLGININEFYGQTECNMVLANSHTIFQPKPNSMGRAMPGHKVAIVDKSGKEVVNGCVGEIAVLRPDPVMFLKYWNRPEATASKFTGDWLRTGDMGQQDEEGYFTFSGREDDIISSAGYRIGPAEVEEVLVKHADVLMAAVVGAPDPVRGQVVKAFVQLVDSSKESAELMDELKQWVKIRLAAHEYPRIVEFVKDFPMTPSGKIQRSVLRQREEKTQAGGEPVNP